MITGFQISERLFSILNVSAITNLLNGRIYPDRLPRDPAVNDLRNIVIVPLVNMIDFVKQAVVNINVYCPDYDDGTPNATTFQAITDQIHLALESYSSLSDYFAIEIVSSGMVTDENNQTFLNIRIEIITT
jgi:hypothetical protein